MIAVILIVGFVICLQIYFFVANRRRMNMFGSIFVNKDGWTLEWDGQFVSGISGNGNIVFQGIKCNINNYLGSNQGAVIDFNILKDSVDRNCDSIEDEINAQMPVPLYCGLAGTMAGVIIGLYNLLERDSITSLMGSGSGLDASQAMAGAALGINDLLTGVALAMCASIVGIFLTTWNSISFKKFKNEEERGKNEFLSWMQSVLLPKLPNDISDAFTRLVKNLNTFNGAFQENTRSLGITLDKINRSYAIQSNIVDTIQKMDVQKMATANVRVLRELEGCTDKLAIFNQYLNDIQGYTSEIESFRMRLQSEANMVTLLQQMREGMEQIRDFFSEELTQIETRKSLLGDSVDKVDDYLNHSISNLKESSLQSVTDLKNSIDDQSLSLSEFLEKEQNALSEYCNSLRNEFENQVSQIPVLSKRLEDITRIPDQLEKVRTTFDQSASRLSSEFQNATKSLVAKIDNSNRDLANDMKRALKSLDYSRSGDGTSGGARLYIPAWMKVVVIFLLLIIALATAGNLWLNYNAVTAHQEGTEEVDSTAAMRQDSVQEASTKAVVKDTMVANPVHQSKSGI